MFQVSNSTTLFFSSLTISAGPSRLTFVHSRSGRSVLIFNLHRYVAKRTLCNIRLRAPPILRASTALQVPCVRWELAIAGRVALSSTRRGKRIHRRHRSYGEHHYWRGGGNNTFYDMGQSASNWPLLDLPVPVALRNTPWAASEPWNGPQAA